jgi:hypothetical protein
MALEEFDQVRRMARERRFAEAAELLRPLADGQVGMGGYAPLGYGAEEMGDNFAKDGDKARARAAYDQAVRHYLLYSLFPGRGDSEEYGYELAETVVEKLEQLE